jgi:FlaA1/EpsC-like NDP-sugar epimerase
MLIKARRIVIVLINVLLIAASLLLAWALRFEFALPFRHVLLAAMPLLLLFRMAALARFNLLHGYWTYAGVRDVEDLLKALAAGSVAFFVVERYLLHIRAFPLSIYCIEPILTMALLGGARLLPQMAKQFADAMHERKSRKRVLVVGAGAGAAMLVHELPNSGYVALGMVDDDRLKAGAKVHGVPVLGSIDALPELARRYEPDEILIAIPSASGRQMRRIVDCCQRTRVRFRTIPGLAELLDGTVTIRQLRDVNLEDLLGREAVQLDLAPVRRRLEGRQVMVTGAAGSIGSELCVQLLRYHPAGLLCVDQDESGLFFLEQRLERQPGGAHVNYRVADIADRQRMRGLLQSHGVEAIFHAAAYKHVPMMESNVGEAVRNNIFALLALLDVAEASACRDFLMISSDKAVNPSNVMGCTKRVGELILAARPQNAMRTVSVRFGNVLGSQGSVVPVLQEQIRTQQRVTVTHPEITRFFMTIPEAVSLVLQAFTVGRHGEILVLDMGEPMRIADLARTLIRLMGKDEEEVEVVYTGLRKGEKLFEELFYAAESLSPSECDKVLRTSGQLVAWPALQQHLQELYALIYTGSAGLIRAKLKQIVPEYSYGEAPVTRVAVTAAKGRAVAVGSAGA